MHQIPDFFIADLEKQIKEQYKKIIRNRDLRNDEIDENLREKYAKEITLRQKNIKEIQTEFLNQVRIENPNITETEITKISNAVVAAVLKELDTFKSDLQTFIKADIKTAISQLNFTFSTETQAKLQEQFDFLQQENKEGVLALTNLLWDVLDKQEDTDKEMAKIIPLIKEIKSSDVLDAKIKLALPLLEYLGIAKIEAELELKPIPLAKQVWEKLKSWKKGSNSLIEPNTSTLGNKIVSINNLQETPERKFYLDFNTPQPITTTSQSCKLKLKKEKGNSADEEITLKYGTEVTLDFWTPDGNFFTIDYDNSDFCKEVNKEGMEWEFFIKLPKQAYGRSEKSLKIKIVDVSTKKTIKTISQNLVFKFPPLIKTVFR